MKNLLKNGLDKMYFSFTKNRIVILRSMKKLVYFVSLIVLISCKTEKKEEQLINKEPQEQGIQTREFTSKGDKFSQTLKLTWSSEEKVDYELSFKNQNCEMQLEGTALLKTKRTLNKIRNDINKKEYLSYLDQKEKLNVILYLASEEKDHGIATISHKSQTETCTPFSNPMYELATE